jgi:hypothetical protein
MRTAAAVLPIVAAALAAACGARAPEGGRSAPPVTAGEPSVLKLRHQISFRHGDDVQVFEGYMLLSGEKLLVRAFAGPGVDLFTVVRDGAAHRETLQIPGLADRIDMPAVGADIARVYLGGCARPEGAGDAACAFYGEPMTETYDGDGRLVARRFPEAHGVGLDVAYERFEACAGEERAGDITLRWGTSGNEMTIHLAACEAMRGVDPAVFAAGP